MFFARIPLDLTGQIHVAIPALAMNYAGRAPLCDVRVVERREWFGDLRKVVSCEHPRFGLAYCNFLLYNVG